MTKGMNKWEAFELHQVFSVHLRVNSRALCSESVVGPREGSDAEEPSHSSCTLFIENFTEKCKSL